MDQPLRNRVALVTGSSHGIGRAIALSLARDGADVVLCGRSIERVLVVKSEIEKMGVRAYAHALDARKEDEVIAMIKKVVHPLGRLDILVNNIGGVREHSKFEELEERHWRESWELNFLTAVFFVQATLSYIRQSKTPRIVFIASSAGKQPGGFNPHYGAAKTALVALSKALANTYASEGVLVNTVCPATVDGGIRSEHVRDKAIRNNISIEEAGRLMAEEVIQKTPLGKICTPEDVADLVSFLASDKAKSITGTCIQVDGGMIKSIF